MSKANRSCFSLCWKYTNQAGRCALFLIIACFPLLAQEPSQHQRELDIADSKKRTEEYVEKIRPYLFGNLQGTELAIYKTIQFRVTALEVTWKASSGKEDDVRYIELDEGVARQMETLSTALEIEKMQDREVLIPYLRYVAASMNAKKSFIKDVTTFAHVDPDKLDRNRAANVEIATLVVNGMAFLLAHEVGHHVLGHYDRKRTTDLATLRQMELDADEWAVNRCLGARPHFSPIGGMMPLMFAYYTTPHPIAREASTDHPAEVRRIHAMFKAMQSSLPDFREELIRKGQSYPEFKRFVDDMVSRYEREVNDDSPPVEELSSQDSKKGDREEQHRSASDRRTLHDHASRR